MNTAPQLNNLPPMLTQYLEYKKQYPDSHLFFQVGDFYELFFEDAQVVSRLLNLTLTTRDKHDPNPVPMCGVPIAVIDNYIDRLVSRGHSVALVSQVGEVGAKGVARKLDRLITPGVRLLGNSSDDAATAIVASCVYDSESDIAFAFSEIQSGVISVRESVTRAQFLPEVLKLGLTEIVLPKSYNGKGIDRRSGWVRELSQVVQGDRDASAIKFRPESYFEVGRGARRDCSTIRGYSALSDTAKKAVRLLLSYVDEITIDKQITIREIAPKTYSRVLMLDATTRSNLELVRNTRDAGISGTLFEHLNATRTSAGARLLRQWILNPLSVITEIKQRQEAVWTLMQADEVRGEIQNLLASCCDVERVAARIELDVANPRELGGLRDALTQAPRLSRSLSGFHGELPVVLAELCKRLEVDPGPLSLLSATLADNPPLSSSDGEIIRAGFSAEVDRLRELKTSGKSWILDLEAAERARTGISSLKIKFNNVLGFFIEVTRANVEKVPNNYIRRQSTVNGERYTTPELSEREEEIVGAEGKLHALERRHFEELRRDLKPYLAQVRLVAAALAESDVLAALAEVSRQHDYVRPEIDDSTELEIVEGRHPVLATRLGGDFVPNGLSMHARNERCIIITGPNMGGKSTFIRQTGLLVILAQLGCGVPARRMRLGAVDRMFARIGASDNIAEGESTFMVEMREAAHISAAASERSLLLIDEIGRGTATTDGLALAQSILEWIVLQLRCRTLFATHFHELTQLEAQYAEIANISVGSKDRDGDVVFTHQMCTGPASKSYGLEVAKLAGLPEALIRRARELLEGIEKRPVRSSRQLALFHAPAQAPESVVVTPDDYQSLCDLRSRLLAFDVNRSTPLQALHEIQSAQDAVKGKAE